MNKTRRTRPAMAHRFGEEPGFRLIDLFGAAFALVLTWAFLVLFLSLA